MKYTIEYIPELHLIQCTYIGPVPIDEIKKGQIKASKLAKENNTTLFLVDLAEFETVLSTLDIHNWPVFLDEVITTGIAGGLISPIRALLLAPLKGYDCFRMF